MKDLFKNYHKHKVLSNIGVLSISALLAVSVNMFVLNGDTGQALKANVLESTVDKVNQVDFLAQANANSIVFENTQEIQNVTEFSFSLAYNAELLTFGEYTSAIEGGNISLIENNDGFSTYIMTFESPLNISQGSKILDVDYKKSLDETAYLNPINVNFTDVNSEKFILSTQGIIF